MSIRRALHQASQRYCSSLCLWRQVESRHAARCPRCEGTPDRSRFAVGHTVGAGTCGRPPLLVAARSQLPSAVACHPPTERVFRAATRRLRTPTGHRAALAPCVSAPQGVLGLSATQPNTRSVGRRRPGAATRVGSAYPRPGPGRRRPPSMTARAVCTRRGAHGCARAWRTFHGAARRAPLRRSTVRVLRSPTGREPDSTVSDHDRESTGGQGVMLR